MTGEELLTKYEKGERDFRDTYLVYANLSRVNLAGANLEGASLYRASLYRANLSGAHLDGATYGDAKLTPEILAWLVLGACHDGVMGFIRGETTQVDVAWCQDRLGTDETDVT